MSVFDPLGILNITAPKSEAAPHTPGGYTDPAYLPHVWDPNHPELGGSRPTSGGPSDRAGTYAQNAYDAYQAGQGRSEASAGASANTAGTNAANAHFYWDASNPNNGGARPIDPAGAAAYDAWQAGQLRSEGAAGESAGNAGNLAATQGAQRNADAATAKSDAAGLNFMKPGANESFYAEHGSDMFGPNSYDEWLKQHQNDLNGPGIGGAYAQSQIDNHSPLPPANMDPYYDRAVELSTRKIDSELAARGNYGSSVGLGQIGSSITDLRAQQARDEAKYGLDRSDLERNWTGTLGGLANTADQDAATRFAATAKAEGVSSEDALARWQAAQTAASSAQGSQRTRGQDLFNNTMGVGTQEGNVVGQQLDAASATDAQLMDAIIALGLGKSAEEVAAAVQRANTDEAYKKQVIDAFNTYRASQGTSSKTTTTGPSGTSTSTTTTGTA